MTMTPEERKEYNKKYYKSRVEKLKEDKTYEVVCELCDKKLTKNNLKTHLKSKYCKNNYELKLAKLTKLKKLNDLS